MFWDSHSPSFEGSRQYRSAILYHNDEQRQQAQASKAQQEAKLGQELFTAIEPFQEFTWAEDYHQKFNLRQNAVFFQEYTAIYPNLEDFVNSTAVARVNAYVIGIGRAEQAKAELDQLGLSTEAQDQLLTVIKRLQ